MTSDARIAELRQRVQRWLHETPSGEGTGIGTIEGLDADLVALEADLRTLFQRDGSTPDSFGALREQVVLRTVLGSMVEGVIVADMAGRLLIFNTAARNLLGQGPADHVPGAWSEAYGLFRADGETSYPSEELPLSRSLRGEAVDREEMIIRAPERQADCHVAASGRPLRDEGGRRIGAVVVFHDITDTKALERELRRARESAEETARVKSEFLANMSHEIRTPMTAVLGFTDLLLAPSLSDSDRLNYVQAVRRNGEHLLALINDVLDISKINANQVNVESVEFSLPQVLHEAASLMQVRACEKGLAFDVAYETPMPVHIVGDPMRVRQILLNLLSNAIKFTQEGGVKLTARCLAAGTDASRLELAVTDTGIGLSTAEIDGLFQPFRQANASTTRLYGGTGLGLAISRSLAEALGGEVRVQSAPGKGSTFTLRLYQALDAQAETVAELDGSSSELDVEPEGLGATRQLQGRILLAEDGLDNQLLLSTILRRQGLEVEIADNGQSAVAQALAALDANAPFDVVLMDMQMPRLDGYGAASRLRAKGYTGPVIALTAHAMPGERERCLLAGCDDYLSKPIDRPVLLAAVASYLKRERVVGPEPATPDTLSGSGVAGQGTGPLLYSSVADDPDMEVLVTGFVARLPLQVQDVRLAMDDGDLERVRCLAHQIKGAAGSYGFMAVSRDAQALEAAARHANQVSEVFGAVHGLAATCDRVRPGQQGAPPMSERRPQSVLVVDDSVDIHQLVSVRLRSEGVTLLHAHDAEEGLDLALRHLPDLVLLDLEMPGIDGMTLCRQIMEDPTLSAIPVIFLTGTIDVATKVLAFELGAVDYVTKPFDAIELKARVRSALRTKRYRDLLTTKAQIDALTGLWNRGYFDDRLAVEISVMARQGCPISLILFDIDHFKSINDTHGHPFGDLVIQRVAEVLGRVSRDSDIACRYGGEEFAIILRNTLAKGALAIAERLREEIAAMPLVQGRDRVRVTASFGIAGSEQFDAPSQASPETLLAAADKALYRAKSDGRNRVGMRPVRGERHDPVRGGRTLG